MDGQGSAPNPAGGAHSASIDPLAGGMGRCPLPKNPTPTLGLRPSVLAPMNNSGHALEGRVWFLCG